MIRLATGEIAATVLFWVYLFMIKERLGETKLIIVVYPLSVLSFILIQGSIYWFILLKRMSNSIFLVKYTGKIYRLFRVMDVIFLCLGIPIILMNYGNVIGTGLSVLILLFSFIEWINYYIVRLSYGLNPMVLIKHMKNRTLKKSKIAKEIDGR